MNACIEAVNARPICQLSLDDSHAIANDRVNVAIVLFAIFQVHIVRAIVS